MIEQRICKERAEKLLDLARAYRGWTRNRLGAELRRDPSHILPEKSFPPQDLVAGIADALDWEVGYVSELLMADNGDGHNVDALKEFQEADDRTLDAHASGDGRRVIELARDQYACAGTADQRALAKIRELGGWDRLGLYNRALNTVQEAEHEGPTNPVLRRVIESNLANAHYMLWNFTESRMIARSLVEHFQAHAPDNGPDTGTQAFAQYVLGNTYRRMLTRDADNTPENALLAERHLREAIRQYRAMDREMPGCGYAGIAHTCFGALAEVLVVLGRVDASRTIKRLHEGLEPVIDVDAVDDMDTLESFGWWCVFGCNIAMRLSEAEQATWLGIFNGKAVDIAERTGNWALQERAWTIEHKRCQLLSKLGVRPGLTLDRDNIRGIIGVMGRFAGFREPGWELLRTATVIAD